MKRFQLLILLPALFLCEASAQGPANTGTYYATANGKSGQELKTALCAIVGPHIQRTYSQLWEDFKRTDLRPDGKIWDMYSGVTNFDPDTGHSGNYKKEGDVFNREHSMPKSWFNDEYPMYTDLFHLYPTDGYVNNRRSNYPFGETIAPTYRSGNDFSKLGPGKAEMGYTGVVFEPNDEYKGDFARTYFYMVTAYESYTTPQGTNRRVASWNSPMLAQNTYPVFTDWALALLLRWSALDPVSEKELKRNEAVFLIQNNRNPFIDYPGLEQYIWGDRKDVPFSYDQYENGIINIPIAAQVQRDAAVVYDLCGRKLDGQRLRKGIYVRNGRKLLVK